MYFRFLLPGWNITRVFIAEACGVRSQRIMASNTRRKRSYLDESRSFKESLTTDFFFNENYGKPLCPICQEIGSVMNKYNLSRHYTSKHSKYENIRGHEGEEKIKRLLKSVRSRQAVFKKVVSESEGMVRAS